MDKIFGFINQWIFAPILDFFLGLTGGNYALSIFLFTLILNVILIPLSVKSQKASVSQLKIKPKLDELKKRCGDDKQKYNAGMQKLYQENNVSMGGGCLPMILRLVLVMSVYYLVLSPLTYFTELKPDTITEAINTLPEAFAVGKNTNYGQLRLIEYAESLKSGPIYDAIKGINFDFFGISLTDKPEFTLNFSKQGIDYKLWIIPFLSFAAAMFSSVLSLIQQKRSNPDAPNMAGMMLTMPIISLVIAFGAPAGLGFYWACSSLIGAFIQMFVNHFYGPAKLVAKEQSSFILKRAAEEQKYTAGKNSAQMK